MSVTLSIFNNNENNEVQDIDQGVESENRPLWVIRDFFSHVAAGSGALATGGIFLSLHFLGSPQSSFLSLQQQQITLVATAALAAVSVTSTIAVGLTAGLIRLAASS